LKNSNAAFKIGDYVIGTDARAFLIAEVAQAHCGSVDLAHSFVDAALNAGADAVKFQTHIASAESTLNEPFRVKFSDQYATRYDYWKKMEFTSEQWAGLAAHARRNGLVFLSSAFSIEAVDLLNRIGMPAWKIASGEVSSMAIVDAMIATGAPFLVSTGMSSWAEIDELTSRLSRAERHVAVLQCTSSYPTPLDRIGLNVLKELQSRYGLPVGLSDHSGSVHAPIAAIARGAKVVELHLTLDRQMFGPDVIASLTVPEFRLVSEFRNALGVMDSNPVDKDAIATELSQMGSAFRRSLAPSRPLEKGMVLTEDMLLAKKPGTGIPEGDLQKILGRRLARAVGPERLLNWNDFEEERQ
jgi:N,N'-diacetyllegionaminate synthase